MEIVKITKLKCILAYSVHYLIAQDKTQDALTLTQNFAEGKATLDELKKAHKLASDGYAEALASCSMYKEAYRFAAKAVMLAADVSVTTMDQVMKEVIQAEVEAGRAGQEVLKSSNHYNPWSGWGYTPYAPTLDQVAQDTYMKCMSIIKKFMEKEGKEVIS